MKNSVRSGERRRRVLGSLTAGALIAGTLSAFGFAAAAPASAATQLEKSYNYKCDVDAAGLPLGIKDVGVKAEVEVPDSVAPGETIPARKTQITLTMPEDLRDATTGLLGAKTAGGSSSDSAIVITAPGISDLTVPIANLAAPQTDVPTEAGASWTIPTEGDVPDITVPASASEAATLHMPAAFNIDATLIRADGTIVGSEGAVKLACSLDPAGPNGDGVFGAIPIVVPVNQAPVASDVSVTTDGGSPVDVALDASDPDGDELTYTVGEPEHGTVTGTAPDLTYTPDDGYIGTDSFTYTVSDGVNEATATVTVTVKDGSLPVVTEDIAIEGHLVRGANVNRPVVTLKGSGGSGALTYTTSDITGPDDAKGVSIQVTGDQAKLMLGTNASVGDFSFAYTATDAVGTSSTSTVTFTIGNDAPIVQDRTFTTTKGKPFDGWPWARDAESGGPFPWSDVAVRITYGEPEHGTVEPFFSTENGDLEQFVDVQHKYTYVPDPDFVGTDSFSVTMTDDEGASSTGTVTINVVDPGPAARGVLHDVRYRCAFSLENEALSALVSRVMGGDVTFRIDVSSQMPQKVAPGEKFTVPDTDITLNMAQPMAELLAGSDLTVDPIPPLDELGFGQTSVQGSAVASPVFTETATGRSYEIPMTDLTSAEVPMTMPVPANGVAIPVKGGLPELTAPASGELQVSMPDTMRIDSVLTPGVLGAITDVGLDCTAMEGEELSLGSISVVDEPEPPKPVASSVKASVKGAPYGVSPKVAVTVAPGKAGGRVEVRKGSKVLARTTVTKGRATVVLPRTALRPGKHTLAVRYLGDKATKASSTKVTVKITKAKTKVTAKVTTKKVVAKKTRAKVRVKVKATGMRPAGRVAVMYRGKRIGVAKVRANGTAVVKLRKLPKVGKATLKVKYLGNAKAKASTKKIKIKVKRKRR